MAEIRASRWQQPLLPLGHVVKVAKPVPLGLLDIEKVLKVEIKENAAENATTETSRFRVWVKKS